MLCSSEHSHDLWMTEARQLVVWRLPEDAEDFQLAVQDRAAAFPSSQGTLTIKALLREAQTTQDLHLIPPVSGKQRKYQQSFLRATFHAELRRA